jgi:CBS domain-containing protein
MRARERDEPLETAVIAYRVADFLKKYPPFHAVDDADLLGLAARGRVRFHEPNEYILWQGEPHRLQVFVIQQGTVSLWDETGERVELKDVRGVGDMLGIERYCDAPHCLYSGRSESDVVIYAFPAMDFDGFVLKYPYAAQYVAAEGRVTPDYQPTAGRRDPQRTYLHAVAGRKPLSTCRGHDSIAHVARRFLDTQSEAMAVVDAGGRAQAVLTSETLLAWVAAGGGNAQQQVIETLLEDAPTVLSPDASVTDGVIAMGRAAVPAIAITADGTPDGRLQAIVTPTDLALLFGEQPATLLRDIRLAGRLHELRELNQRARALSLEYLTGAPAVEWLARLTHLIDAAIVTRLLALTGVERPPGCWCFCGSSGRGESLTKLAPHVLVVLADGDDELSAQDAYDRLLDAMEECDYLPRELPYDQTFYVAGVHEWMGRYREWIRDPVMQEMFRARTLFDLRPVHGPRSLWQQLDAAVAEHVDRDFLHVVANDCLASLPPLTFFQDAVVGSDGEHRSSFRLEHSALRPLVDVGRVFALAAGKVLGRSTLERFATARALLPEHEKIFREAADTFRVVLWQQGRVGISQGTSGVELPPALLSRHDRHVLKAGFRSIHRLLEFTAEREWLRTL